MSTNLLKDPLKYVKIELADSSDKGLFVKSLKDDGHAIHITGISSVLKPAGCKKLRP